MSGGLAAYAQNTNVTVCKGQRHDVGSARARYAIARNATRRLPAGQVVGIVARARL
jgi:hypothetical protein